jgi:hypothetical protein
VIARSFVSLGWFGATAWTGHKIARAKGDLTGCPFMRLLAASAIPSFPDVLGNAGLIEIFLKIRPQQRLNVRFRQICLGHQPGIHVLNLLRRLTVELLDRGCHCLKPHPEGILNN